MSSKHTLAVRLKEGCFLTSASWAARIFREHEEWKISKTANIGKEELDFLIHFLKDEKFLSWIGYLPLKKKSSKLQFTALNCVELYSFPVTTQELILVGSNELLDKKSLRLWKYIANLEYLLLSIPADQEIDLLQHTVLELELTQQELQARISAQREAEARLIQAAKLAAVGEMAAGVAHELNNPLTSVVGFTELVLEDLEPNSRARADLELVLQEARRARSVVRGLLDFARQSETIRVRADINEIVGDVLMLTRHLLLTSKVQIEDHLTKNLKWVMVDRNQIKQVVINLINNSLYAMPKGGRIVIETSEQVRYGQSWLRLSVNDNGIGIPPENLERIFEPFFTTRGDQGGTGLGLSVTYGIVTDHGGMIEVESMVDHGSKFDVWLPMDTSE